MARRSGFTLLEVVLATGIAVMLLGGLYVAVDMQLRLAQQARDLVQESTLSRALFDRMDNDGSQVVDVCDPARFRLAAGADTGTGASSTTGTSATTGATGASSSSSSSTSSTDGGTTTNIVLPLGVEGDSETLHLFISRVPREALADLNNPNDVPPVVSDLRRVSYWLAGGDGSPAGLARQEIPLVTSDDALQNLPPGIDNESSYVLADEVRSLNFQYFDGTDWQDSWDSTTLGADGVTPVGSPRAIAVTIGIAPSRGPGTSQTDDANLKTYRHVLVIPSANGTTAMSQATTGTTGTGTTGTGMTGSGAAP
jgi:Tfp pilus assembly protein PilV